MAKTTNPLMSFDARGKLANSIIFSKWKTLHVTKELQPPAQPRTPAQLLQRKRVSQANTAASALWQVPMIRDGWRRYASSTPGSQTSFSLLLRSLLS